MTTDDERATRIERELFLRSFGGVRPSSTVTRQFAEAMKDVYFPAGSVVYERGGEPDLMHFIVHGEISLEAPDAEPWTFVERELVGVIDVILDRPQARNAIAQSDVRTLALAGEDWLEIMEDNFDYARSVLWSVAGSLHDMCLQLAPSGGFAEPAQSDDWELCDYVEMNLVERISVLHHTEAFQTATIQSLTRLAREFSVVRLSENESLFETGWASGVLYVTALGVIQVERPRSPKIVARFGRGDPVCGYMALGDVEEEYSARATSPRAVVLKIEEEKLIDVMEDHFDVLRSMMRGVSAFREKLMIQLAERGAVSSRRAEPQHRPLRPSA